MELTKEIKSNFPKLISFNSVTPRSSKFGTSDKPQSPINIQYWAVRECQEKNLYIQPTFQPADSLPWRNHDACFRLNTAQKTVTQSCLLLPANIKAVVVLLLSLQSRSSNLLPQASTFNTQTSPYLIAIPFPVCILRRALSLVESHRRVQRTSLRRRTVPQAYRHLTRDARH